MTDTTYLWAVTSYPVGKHREMTEAFTTPSLFRSKEDSLKWIVSEWSEMLESESSTFDELVEGFEFEVEVSESTTVMQSYVAEKGYVVSRVELPSPA